MADYPYSYTGPVTITGERPLLAPRSNVEVRSEDDWDGVLIFEEPIPDVPSHPTVRFGRGPEVVVLAGAPREVAEYDGITFHLEITGLGPVPFGPPQTITPGGVAVEITPGTPTVRIEGSQPPATGSVSARISAATATADAVAHPGVVTANEEAVTLELTLQELDPNTPDPDGVLSATSAAIARGVPDALLPQVRDVRRRMKQLGDTDVRDHVSLAAYQAEFALHAVELHLSGELAETQARPHGRGLAVLMAEILQLGAVVLKPEVYPLFRAAYLIVFHLGYLKRESRQ